MLDIKASSEGITQRIHKIRSVCAEQPDGPVLAESSSQADIASLSVACWQEERRVVFPPTLRETMLEQIADDYDCIRLSPRGIESFSPGEEDDRTFSLRIQDMDIGPDTELADFYTSGSTGEPDRVPKSARQLFGEARMLCDRFDIDEDDVLVSGVPANHLYGFLFSFLIPLVSGCRVAYSTPLHAESVATLCSSLGATILVSTPAQLNTLRTVSPDRFPEFERIFSSGDALAAKTRRALESSGLDVTEIFGSTETGGIAVREGTSPQVWEPLPGVEVRAGDDKRMELRSEYTRQPDTFIQTDDLIEEVDGSFRHIGRADAVVKVGGRRVSTLALRQRLEAHEAVDNAELVELISEHADTTRLYGFVQSSQDISAREIRTYLLQWFEPATVPRVHIVAELPRTPMGKVTREALVELIEQLESGGRPTLAMSEPEEVGDDSYEVDFHVPEDSVYFDGHFPSFPILPGVVQVTEVALKYTTQIWPELDAPESVRRLKFIAPIMPNAELTLRLERTDGKVSFRIHSDEQEFCKGQFVFQQGGASQ